MKKYKVTSKAGHETAAHFCFEGIRKYDFEPYGFVIMTNEDDVAKFKDNDSFIVEEITETEE